ncbi:MAG: hypothetical protein EBQ71_13010 [Betaproteobacteria bacterium]|nr:hypothetical protein [Betaproteobacteria bacterium]
MTKDAWNSPLIGKSTSEFLATGATPSLCLDLDIMQRNIATMQTVANRYKKGLRPHMKAHKSGQIGAMQREQVRSAYLVRPQKRLWLPPKLA